MAVKDWELYFLSVIKGEKLGTLANLLRFSLWLLSIPFRIIVSLRNWLFDHGWLKSYIPPVPLVISVGNITAGGTGKTPVTMLIAKELNQNPLAILSRGYRSQAEKKSAPLLLHKSQGIVHPASLCGDEPFLLSENLPEAYVIVGKDRSTASKMAARMGVETIILDDGMQHRAIARDLEVVVMDLLDPFGQGYFLPRGLLREDRKALARADIIILNHAHDLKKFEEVKRQISHETSAPIVGTEMEVTGCFDLKNNSLTLPMKVGIFCSIAHPDYFRNTVQKMGGEVVSELFLPDHDNLDLDELLLFSQKSKEKGATYILCTEKDRVKLVEPCMLDLPIGWVKTHLRVAVGHEHWQSFINQAKTSLHYKGCDVK